jgi:hypothetical protein
MPMLPLTMPPGMYRNGTALQAVGRWRDGSLVRWREGILQPIRGWTNRAPLPAGALPARGAAAWRDNSGDRWLALGTANALYVLPGGNILNDITPDGLVPGIVDAVANTGYAGGFYGAAGYGTERDENGPLTPATTWSLDNWGENLLACSMDDGKLYEWRPGTPKALPIANAPTGCKGVMATEDRFVLALAANGNPRKVAWCDRENNTVWTPAATNQAGDIELQTGGEIACGLRVRGSTLLLTDQDAHAAQYIGPPYVYGFERVGDACGVISRRAAVSVDAGAYWMGRRGFYRYAGGGVEPVASEVSDFVFRDLNRAQASKVWAVANSAFSEVWWFYPSEDQAECNRYVVLNYAEGFWYTGQLSRTAGVDQGLQRHAAWVDPQGQIYNHEVGLQHGEFKPWVESAPVSLGAGDAVLSAVSLVPDELTQGDVSMSFRTRFHPQSQERTYGPYSMAAPTAVRFTGRQVVMRIDASRLADWRVGVPKLDVRPGGLR